MHFALCCSTATDTKPARELHLLFPDTARCSYLSALFCSICLIRSICLYLLYLSYLSHRSSL